MTDPRINGPIGAAYAAYDSDPRANGPDGFEAFADAVSGLFDFLIEDWTRATWEHADEARQLDVEAWLNHIRGGSGVSNDR